MRHLRIDRAVKIARHGDIPRNGITGVQVADIAGLRAGTGICPDL